MLEKLGEEQVTSKKVGKIKPSPVRDLGVGSSKKKKSFSKIKKAKAIIVEPAKEIGNNKSKRGRAEAAREMAKRLPIEKISTDPLQHVLTPDVASDAETKFQVLMLRTR